MTAKNLDGHILAFEDAGGRQYGVPAEAVCIGSFTIYAHNGQHYPVPVSATLVGQGKASSGHYHIRWSTEVLDWEAFESRTDAEASAVQLVLPDETYTIEERDEDCPRCRNALRQKTSHEPQATDPNRKYSWQQAVDDAFQSPRKNLPLKFNAAQLAISARLCDKTHVDLNEQIAIREALQSLSALLLELSPKQSSELESGAKDREETA